MVITNTGLTPTARLLTTLQLSVTTNSDLQPDESHFMVGARSRSVRRWSHTDRAEEVGKGTGKDGENVGKKVGRITHTTTESQE